MSVKTVTFKPIPPRNLQEFVSGEAASEPMQSKPPGVSTSSTTRLTVDIPDDLHRRVRVHCAENGFRLADVVRKLLHEAFPEGADQTASKAS